MAKPIGSWREAAKKLGLNEDRLELVTLRFLEMRSRVGPLGVDVLLDALVPEVMEQLLPSLSDETLLGLANGRRGADEP